MYLELLITSIGTQESLAAAYVASSRQREVGLYFLAINATTVNFFAQIEPPELLREVHRTFLEWQDSGIEALTQELNGEDAISAAQRHIDKSQVFSEAMRHANALATGLDAREP